MTFLLAVSDLTSVWFPSLLRLMMAYLYNFLERVGLLQRFYFPKFPRGGNYLKWHIKGILDELSSSRQKLLPCRLYTALIFIGIWEIVGKRRMMCGQFYNIPVRFDHKAFFHKAFLTTQVLE